MNKKKKLLKNTIIILIGKMCTQLVSFLLLPLYTSYLVTDEYGIVDLVITYVSLLVPVLSLQLDMAIFRFLIDSRENKTKQKKLVSSNFFLLLICIILSILLLLIMSLFINNKYIYIILLIVIFNMLSGNLMQISRGLGDNITYSISSVIVGVTTVLLNVIFIVFFHLQAIGMLLSMLFANVLATIYLFFKLKIYEYINIKFVNKELSKKMIKYSLPLIPNGISWWIMNASDRTIIQFFIGISYNGIYAISNKFSSIVTTFFGIFNLAWSESASININENDKDEYFSSVCNDVLDIFGCSVMLLISIIPFIFSILINKNYNAAYVHIPILLISSFFSLMASQYGSIYIAKKETKKIAITTFISAIINILINLLLIKKIGLYAASISTLISYCIIMLYRHFDIQKFVIVKYSMKKMIYFVIMITMILFAFYSRNLVINIFSIIICLIFSIKINRTNIKKFSSLLIKKIK